MGCTKWRHKLGDGARHDTVTGWVVKQGLGGDGSLSGSWVAAK